MRITQNQSSADHSRAERVTVTTELLAFICSIGVDIFHINDKEIIRMCRLVPGNPLWGPQAPESRKIEVDMAARLIKYVCNHAHCSAPLVSVRARRACHQYVHQIPWRLATGGTNSILPTVPAARRNHHHPSALSPALSSVSRGSLCKKLSVASIRSRLAAPLPS